MRTTVDPPEALRGSTLKQLIVEAIEKEVNGPPGKHGKRVELPLVRQAKGKKLDLSSFDFDDLLA